MATLRWWANKIRKQNIVPRDNDSVGIKTHPQNKTSRARELNPKALADVASAHIALSLELQRHFGLRREEAIKIRPLEADHIDHIELRPSWCKGGRGRRIPITTIEQSEILERAKDLVGAQSMVIPGLNYKEHLRRWKTETRKIGLPKTHGLRHRFAQELYQRLTGFPPPLAGGPNRAQLSDEQRQQDRQARETITEILRHSRLSVTNTYLGK
jgi:integrase